jgi:hypothetical protein
MSTKITSREVIRSIIEAPQRLVRYILASASRTFTPTDDNYPTTGVQPYEGESAEKKHY